MTTDTDPLEVTRQQAVEWVHRRFAGDLSAEELAEFERWQRIDQSHAECVRMCIASRWAELMKDGDFEPGYRVVFTRWLMADPRNMDEFARAAVFFLNDEDRRVRYAVPLAEWPRLGSSDRIRFRKWMSVALAASVLLAAIGTWIWFLRASPAAELVYFTRTGETKSLTLPDGSTVTLNTQTRIVWNPVPGERRLRLDSGEIYLSVMHAAERPFVVVSDTGTVRVLGTHFDVYRHRDDGRVTVSVLEGRVEVSCAQPDTGSATACDRELAKNQQVVFTRTRIVTDVHEISGSDVLRWRNGEMTVAHASLSDVIGDLARYTDTPIRVIDPQRRLASVHVVAYVRLRVNDVSGALQELQRSGAPISVEGHEGQEFIIRYQDEQEAKDAQR